MIKDFSSEHEFAAQDMPLDEQAWANEAKATLLAEDLRARDPELVNALEQFFDGLHITLEEFADSVTQLQTIDAEKIIRDLLEKEAAKVGLDAIDPVQESVLPPAATEVSLSPDDLPDGSGELFSEENLISTEQSKLQLKNQLIEDVVIAGLRRDKGTAMYGREVGDMIHAAGEILAADPERDIPPVERIQIDIGNMANLNLAIGRENTDDFIDIVTAIYTKHFNDVGAEVVKRVRQGGDEFDFFVQGVDAYNVQAAIEGAKDEIEDLVFDAGLESIVHAKYPDKVTIDYTDIVREFNERDDKENSRFKNEKALVSEIIKIFADELVKGKKHRVFKDDEDHSADILLGVAQDEGAVIKAVGNAQLTISQMLIDDGFEYEKGVDAEFVDNAHRRGASVGAGVVALDGTRTVSETEDALEKAIDRDKIEVGRARSERIEEEGAAESPGFLVTDFHQSAAKNEEEKQRRSQKHKDAVRALSAKKGELQEQDPSLFLGELKEVREKMAWPEKLLPVDTTYVKEQQQLQAAGKNQQKEDMSSGQGDTLDEELQETPDDLTWDVRPNAEYLRLLTVQKAAEKLDFTKEQAAQLERAVAFYDKRDVVTGLKTERDFTDDLEKALQEGRKGVVGTAELINLSGVNGRLGHAKGDVLIAQMAQVIEDKVQSELRSDAKFNLYYRGNGELGFFIDEPSIKYDRGEDEIGNLKAMQEKVRDIFAQASEDLIQALDGVRVKDYEGPDSPKNGRIYHGTTEAKRESKDKDSDVIMRVPHPRRHGLHGTAIKTVTLRMEPYDKMTTKEHLKALDVVGDLVQKRGDVRHPANKSERLYALTQEGLPATVTVSVNNKGDLEQTSLAESADKGETPQQVIKRVGEEHRKVSRSRNTGKTFSEEVQAKLDKVREANSGKSAQEGGKEGGAEPSDSQSLEPKGSWLAKEQGRREDSQKSPDQGRK